MLKYLTSILCGHHAILESVVNINGLKLVTILYQVKMKSSKKLKILLEELPN